MTGMMSNFIIATLPNESGLTTEYSSPTLIRTGNSPKLTVFATLIPTGTVHCSPFGSFALNVIVGSNPICHPSFRLMLK